MTDYLREAVSDLSDLIVQLSMAICHLQWFYGFETAAIGDHRPRQTLDAEAALRDAHAAWDAALVDIERGLGVEEYDPSHAVYTLPGVRLNKPIGSLASEHERWERAREAYLTAERDPFTYKPAELIRKWRIAGARLIAALEGA